MPICVWFDSCGRCSCARPARPVDGSAPLPRLPVAEQLAHLVLQRAPSRSGRPRPGSCRWGDSAARSSARMSSSVIASSAVALALARAGPTARDSAAAAVRASPSAPARPRPPAAPAASPAGRLRAARPADAAGAARRRRSPAPAAGSRPAWRRCSWCGASETDSLALDAQVVQVEDELPAVARAAPRKRHLAGEAAQPARSARIVDAAGRHAET